MIYKYLLLLRDMVKKLTQGARGKMVGQGARGKMVGPCPPVTEG